MSQRKKKLEHNLKQIFAAKEQGEDVASQSNGVPLELLTGNKQVEAVEEPQTVEPVVTKMPEEKEKPASPRRAVPKKPKSSPAIAPEVQPVEAAAAVPQESAPETTASAVEAETVPETDEAQEKSLAAQKAPLAVHGDHEMVVRARETQVDELRKLLIFKLCDGYYGVSVFRVQTIIKPQPVYEIPGTEDFIIGLINLRGDVVPTVDLHKRLGLPAQERSEQTRFVVIEYGEYLASMIVDEVVGVENIPESHFEKPSGVVMDVDTRYLQEITRHGEMLVLVLDLAELIVRKD